jgi:hypothetical protein|nr:MAG TPA: hypothetical protein [Caudoviricetes sp.]
MAFAWKKCRVCGKEYEACRNLNRIAGVFRWQEVACSPECGAEYLRQIMESRGELPAVEKAKRKRHKGPDAAPVETSDPVENE